MRVLTIFATLVVLTACAMKRVASVSSQVGKTAIQSVSEERQVTFTRDAKKTVIKNTDVYLQPHIAEIENSPSLKAQFSQQTTTALNQQVNEILDLGKGNVIEETDVKWFSVGSRDYGRLILT